MTCTLKYHTNSLLPGFTYVSNGCTGITNVHLQKQFGIFLQRFSATQRAKKIVSDSPGLVDFAIGLMNSVFNLRNRQVMFFEEFE